MIGKNMGIERIGKSIVKNSLFGVLVFFISCMKTSEKPPSPVIEIALPPIPAVSQKLVKQVESRQLNPQKERRYNLAYIHELHSAVRHQKIDNKILSRWINVMDQGGSREGIYRALVSDEVYAKMEGDKTPVNKKIMDFLMDYTGRFLSQEIDRDNLAKIGFYTLKRMVVEKTLDVLDSFDKREHLMRWYAVFSGKMAQKYPRAFGRGIRRITEKRVHLKWADLVTYQHIKSEVIVKLHLIFNFLQFEKKR